MLYELVALRKWLEQGLEIAQTVNEVSTLKSRLETLPPMLHSMPSRHQKFFDSLISRYDSILTIISESRDEVIRRIAIIDQDIKFTAQQLFDGNYDLETNYDELIKVIGPVVTPSDVRDLVQQRIQLHTSWKYPALQIGCRDPEWTPYLVAADPLYLMDRSDDALQLSVSQFTAEYQARLRQYKLVGRDLSKLPESQFGFIFSWSYFNYIGLDGLHEFLIQIFAALRPGGLFMFGYNNADTPECAQRAEQYYQSYLPKSQVISLAVDLGFEVYADYSPDPGTHWLELKRPGALHTVKAHQALGEIKRRSD